MKFRSERILALSLFMALLAGAAFVTSSSLAVDSRDEEIARAVESLRAKLVEQRRAHMSGVDLLPPSRSAEDLVERSLLMLVDAVKITRELAVHRSGRK